MCIVSNIGDGWGRTYPYPQPTPGTNPTDRHIVVAPIDPVEFAKLKREVENLKKLLKLAKAMDEAAGTPDCEMEEKVGLIKRLAELLDVDLEDVFGSEE